MGRATREKSVRLAEKLLQIRLALGLSQTGMLEQLSRSDKAYRNYISDFENGKREPPLPVLLKYARLVGISTDVLIDDKMDLPKRLPVAIKKQH